MRKSVGAATLAIALVGLVGCQSGESGSGDHDALSVERLALLADGVGKGSSKDCPLPYDVAKAAAKVGLGNDIVPGAPDDQDAVVATAENGTQPEKDSAWAANPGALVRCTYHVGEDALKIYTIGGRKPGVVSLLVPVMQQAGGMDVSSELAPYVEETKKAAPGEAVQSAGGNVVTVPLSTDDADHVAMVLTVGNMGKTSLKPGQILELAKTFAAQAE
ncbi:hypothetical protein [Streptomyces fradiae]|uniref:hypothetical protein n=1 Tax=Streptomyces fradiae TaxID=1906 RepID=UPI00351122A3